MQFFRFVPSLAWLTPVVIWFGIGETSKVLIIVYTTMFIVLINTMVGVSHIAPNKLRAAACLGATPFKTFIFVTLPATLPFILTGMRLAMGNSFATVVAAEMIAADSGLGYLIFNSRLWMATDKIFIGIVCLGALGLADRPPFPLSHRPLRAPIWADRVVGTRAYSAACRDGGRTVSSPSASVAETVVRTISRPSCAGQGRPRCMVARLSHMITSPLRQLCR